VACNGIFTSLEHAAYDGALMVQDGMSHITPFERDTLFLSIYEACRHRSNPVTDASALTETVLAKLLKAPISEGIIARGTIVENVSKTLRQFDTAAQVQYLAFHPITEPNKT
jgi:transcriptional regulator NrdR family protein